MTITQHIKKDRIDRYMNIKQFFGLGDPYLIIHNADRASILTDTGIILITNKDKSVLITCYVATLKQAMAMYRSVYGKQKMPMWLYNKVKNNNRLVEQMHKDKMII